LLEWSSIDKLLPQREKLESNPMLTATKIEVRQGTGLLVREMLEDCTRRKAPANIRLASGEVAIILPGADVKITDAAVSWKDGNGDLWFVPFSGMVSMTASVGHLRSRSAEGATTEK
jgi:hypothetical protein